MGEKIVERGFLGSWGLGVAVSASFFVFHHCYLSFFFLRVCFVFTSPSLGSCFFLWSSYSVFVQGVLFVLSGFGSLFVLVLDPRHVNLFEVFVLSVMFSFLGLVVILNFWFR